MLSCFWKDELQEKSFTSYPYLQYVEHLDLLVLALVVTRYNEHRYRDIANALWGIGTDMEAVMVERFGSTEEEGFDCNIILARMLKGSVSCYSPGDIGADVEQYCYPR